MGMSSLALAVPLILISVLGLLLNSYILFIVIVTKQPQNANNLLLLHLGVVDSLLSLTFLVFSAPELLRGWTLFGLGTPCNLHGFLFTLLHPVALWTVCALNCDRYYAITAPLHYGTLVNVRKVAIGLGFTWGLSLILCVPPLFKVAPYKHNPGLAGCAPDFAQDMGALWYTVAYISLTWLLPTALILGCNLRVLTIARYHRHRIASAIFEVTISAQVTITHQRNPFVVPAGNLFRSRSAISSVLQLVLSFLILYCPYYAAIVCDSSLSTLLPSWRVHPLVFTVASSLLTCSPPVNGLLYGVKSKVLRATFNNFWRKQMSKSEVTNEIQARTPSTCGSRRPSVNVPLPRPASVQLPRKLSDTTQPRSATLQRISSEQTWRHGLFEPEPLRRTSSCVDTGGTSLQPPVSTIDIPHFRVFRVAMSRSKHVSNPNLTGTNLFLQRVFGVQQQQNKRATAIENMLAAPTPKSPRILITRAFSEESEASPPSSQNADSLTKAYSSASTLLEKKWKKLRYQDEGDHFSSEISMGSVRTESESLMLTGPKQDFVTNCFVDDTESSSSTSDEEHSSGNIYFPFDEMADSPQTSSRRSTATQDDLVLSRSTPLLCQKDCHVDEKLMSCDGLWMTACQRSETVPGGPEEEISFDLKGNEVVRQLYDSSSFPCVLSWPLRRKSSDASRVTLSKSTSDLVGGTEFQL